MLKRLLVIYLAIILLESSTIPGAEKGRVFRLYARFSGARQFSPFAGQAIRTSGVWPGFFSWPPSAPGNSGRVHPEFRKPGLVMNRELIN